MGFGLTQRMLDKFGVNTRQVVIHPLSNTPVAPPFAILPTEPPSGTPAEGWMYFDDDTHELMQYNGSAWEAVGASPGTDLAVAGDVSVGDDLTVGDDLLLSSTGAVITIGPTGTNPVVLTHSADTLTMAASDTLAITTTDKLTVGGIIVPATVYWHFRVGPHASVTEYDLAVCQRAFQVLAMSVVPSTLQGGALTATLVKSTSTATPVKTTTPLHTADAINLNTGAYTVQTITPTVTGADLQFAVGDRLGIDYSAALTAGHAAISIAIKYI